MNLKKNIKNKTNNDFVECVRLLHKTFNCLSYCFFVIKIKPKHIHRRGPVFTNKCFCVTIQLGSFGSIPFGIHHKCKS